MKSRKYFRSRVMWGCIAGLLLNSCKSQDSGQSPEYHVVVYKSRHSLVVKKEISGSTVEEREYAIATGRNPGEKQHEGDLRTPTGKYYVKRVMSTDPADFFYDAYLVHLNSSFNYFPGVDGRPLGYGSYGPKAFVLDYPNEQDVKKGRTGSNIWIHGTSDPKSLGKNASRGCIRMDNSDISELAKYVGVGTKVTITR